MRYEIDENNYITDVYFNCFGTACTEYTGNIPDGYTSLEDWASNANIQAYKIVDSNLVYDSVRDQKLQEKWRQESQNNQPSNPGGGITGDTSPIGAVMEWFSDTAPDNWLLLNGQAVSRTDYNELFALYGTTFGSGDGSTTFNLPDMRKRVPVGKDSSDSDFNTLGKTGGEKTHTLTVDEMPSHSHQFRAVRDAINTDSQGTDGNAKSINGQGNNTGFTPYGVDSIQDAGGDQPHNNLQPYIVTNFIVKAKQSAGLVATVVDNLGSDSATDALSAKQGKELNNNMLKTAIITGEVQGKENQKYIPDYSSIDGTIVSSVLIGCINTNDNNGVEKCVPHIANENGKRISSVTVTTTSESTTFINILVLYK
jgi:microcystin-dependent protein